MRGYPAPPSHANAAPRACQRPAKRLAGAGQTPTPMSSGGVGWAPRKGSLPPPPAFRLKSGLRESDMTLPTTREEAKALGAKQYFTGVPCPHGHVGGRFASNGRCVICSANASLAARKRDPEAYKRYVKNTRERNRETMNQRTREWHAANKERAREYAKAYRLAKPEIFEQYRAKNRDYFNAWSKNRACSKKNRTPKWLSDADIKRMKLKFAEAAWMTRRTGVKHVVDHFYPLQGRNVSGLHCPLNLRVIPARENLMKFNNEPRFERLPL